MAQVYELETKDKEEKKIRSAKKKQIKELEAHRDKLMEYDNCLEVLEECNPGQDMLGVCSVQTKYRFEFLY